MLKQIAVFVALITTLMNGHLMTKPTILITGGAGYIGSHTALLMSQKGYNVIIIDMLIHDQLFNHPWATLIQKDYADKQALHEIFTQNDVIAVMHFAAFIEVGRSVKDPLSFYNNNVIKTLQLLESMLEHNVKKIIFSSSCAVYGIPTQVPLVESHSKNPISPYGSTKLIIEMALKELGVAHDLQFVALRYFNAAGALTQLGLKEQHKPETHVLPLLIDAALNSTPFYIFGTDYPTPDGTCIRDFLHVCDIADAHAKALEYLEAGKPSDFFNLGTGNGFSIKQLIQAVEKIMNCRVKTVVHERRAGDPALLVADPSHALHLLGWKPQFSDLNSILQSVCPQAINKENFSQKPLVP
ncbi:MAG: UDP-glucose 4-epimerase GalE [Candidatus Babeliales bacterium]|nr:UDP-glucose 4-epimerase GalE [Candidatus Babeliales bacterium]